jgi:anti-sigma B factor antagonist
MPKTASYPSEPRGRPPAGLPIGAMVAREQKAARETSMRIAHARQGLSNAYTSSPEMQQRLRAGSSSAILRDSIGSEPSTMPLTFQSRIIDERVAVIRCKGRIAFGPEAEALEAEVERQTKLAGTNFYQVKIVVLNLAETEYIDSSGLGTLLRLYGVLRAVGGGLKLCQLSPKVLRVLEISHLRSFFPPYGSEAEAIQAFGGTEWNEDDQGQTKAITIVCIDPSKDLLAGLNGLLTGSGYEVFTTRDIGEAATLAKSVDARIVVCGPGFLNIPIASEIIEKLSRAKIKVLQLPSDFYTVEAGQASQDLLTQVRALLASQASA